MRGCAEKMLGVVPPDDRSFEERVEDREQIEATVRQRYVVQREKLKQYYDAAAPAREKRFAVGDRVARVYHGRTGSKTHRNAERRTGPFIVSAVEQGERTVQLSLPNGHVRYRRCAVDHVTEWHELPPLPDVPADVAAAANLQRLAPAEPPTGSKRFSTYDRKSRRILEQADAAQPGGEDDEQVEDDIVDSDDDNEQDEDELVDSDDDEAGPDEIESEEEDNE